jgi:hypothetical protein
MNAVVESEEKASSGASVLIAIPKGLEVLALRYINSRRRELPIFQELAEQANFDEIRRLSHNLKGTGTSYGFPDITRLGAGIEKASKEQNLEDVTRQMIALSEYVNVAIHQLQGG